MFGFSPISAAPFSALSGGAIFDCTIQETTAASEFVSALAIYAALISDTATALDTSIVSATSGVCNKHILGTSRESNHTSSVRRGKNSRTR